MMLCESSIIIGLNCLCNETAAVPKKSCLDNNFTCITDFKCYVQKVWDQLKKKSVISWGCLESAFFLSADVCLINKSEIAIYCCNSSAYCNKHHSLLLPVESLMVTTVSTGEDVYKLHVLSLTAIAKSDLH